jgi:hypothetical protein
MISISSSQPVSWSLTPSPAVAPVAAVPAVGAAASSPRDAQTDSGRGGAGSRGSASTAASPGAGRSGKELPDTTPGGQAAPLLPRERSDDSSPSASSDADAARAEQRQEEERKAQEQAEQKLQLQEVLTTVWKASAAVVDVVLGREAPTTTPAQATAAAQSLGSAVPAGAAGAVAPGASAPERVEMTEPVPIGARRDQEPWMYTEQGAGSWEPLETGSLISQRV